MARAFAEAEAAGARGEVPIGAVVVEAASGRVLAGIGGCRPNNKLELVFGLNSSGLSL